MRELQWLRQGKYDAALTALYGQTALSDAKARLSTLLEKYEEVWGQPEELFILSAPGRTELGGNHTDHNGGKILAASVNADIMAVAGRTPDNTVRIRSVGHRPISLNLDRLSPNPAERRSSAALVRGVAAYLRRRGGMVGGFNAITDARVPVGSGLSSSAAFEVLMGAILNHAYNDGNLPYEWLALAGGHAENQYFDKPSGLMDQIACAAGGVVTVDFADEVSPVIRRIPLDWNKTGYGLCMVDVGGNHSGLTDAYAAIPNEMKSVAAMVGGKCLSEVTRSDVVANLSAIRRRCGDRAVLRALHFFAENERVEREVAALEQGDIQGFLEQVLLSGHSSFEYLQNISLTEYPDSQDMAVALCLAQQLLEGVGAWRVHGGGFGGCIQAFVPLDRMDSFTAAMEDAMGAPCCHVFMIREQGSVRLMAE